MEKVGLFYTYGLDVNVSYSFAIVLSVSLLASLTIIMSTVYYLVNFRDYFTFYKFILY